MRRDTIYFIRSELSELIKIGVTVNVATQLRKLQEANPGRLDVLGVCGGDDLGAIHRRFDAWRVHDGWFEPSPDLLAYIASKAEPLPAYVRRTLKGKADAFMAQYPDIFGLPEVNGRVWAPYRSPFKEARAQPQTLWPWERAARPGEETEGANPSPLENNGSGATSTSPSAADRDGKELLTVAHAAALMDMSDSFVRTLIKKGDVPSVMVGGLVRVPRRYIDGLVEQAMTRTDEAADEAVKTVETADRGDAGAHQVDG